MLHTRARVNPYRNCFDLQELALPPAVLLHHGEEQYPAFVHALVEVETGAPEAQELSVLAFIQWCDVFDRPDDVRGTHHLCEGLDYVHIDRSFGLSVPHAFLSPLLLAVNRNPLSARETGTTGVPPAVKDFQGFFYMATCDP